MRPCRWRCAAAARVLLRRNIHHFFIFQLRTFAAASLPPNPSVLYYITVDLLILEPLASAKTCFRVQCVRNYRGRQRSECAAGDEIMLSAYFLSTPLVCALQLSACTMIRLLSITASGTALGMCCLLGL